MKIVLFLGLLVGSCFLILGIIKKNHLLFLALVLFSFSFLTISCAGIYNQSQSSQWRWLPFYFLYFTLPLFLLYAKSISVISLQKKDYLILIPGLLEIIYIFCIWYFKDIYKDAVAINWKLYMLLAFSFNLFLASYGLWKLVSHFKNKYYMYSFLGKRHIKWIKNVLVSIIVSLVLFINLCYLGYCDLVNLLNGFYNFALFVSIVYFGYTTRNILNFDCETEYNSACKKELFEILKKIKEHMILSEDYLKNNFSQRDLSEAIGVPPNKVRIAITSLTHKSFNSYLNCFRVQRAVLYLSDKKYEHYTIDGIAKEVGFHSKSVFYMAFRKTTGFTPLLYKKAFL